MRHPSRRHFMASTAAAGLLGTAPWPILAARPAHAAPATTIRATTRMIEVHGHPATVFGLVQPDGRHGLVTKAGQRFSVRLENDLDEATLIHWHGLTPPWRQDGVPGLSQRPVGPGEAHDYDYHVPLEVREGERVEITFADWTTMAHPMHLHGHHFQVVAIDGERVSGAMRDTVLVPARGRLTIAFDADNPRNWALHCHHLYHMAAGMMTTLAYRS